MRPLRLLAGLVVPVVLAGSLWLVNRASGGATAVTEYPSHSGGHRLALILTGDAGATATIRALARSLAQGGVAGVVITPADARESPSAASAAVERIIRAHVEEASQPQLLLIGADRGAGMAPFVANRMGRDLRDRVEAMVLVALPPRVSFRPSWRDQWRTEPSPTDLPVLPELERMRGTRMLCLYDRRQRDAFCPSLDTALARRQAQPAMGNGDREGAALAKRVLDFVHAGNGGS